MAFAGRRSQVAETVHVVSCESGPHPPPLSEEPSQQAVTAAPRWSHLTALVVWPVHCLRRVARVTISGVVDPG